MIVEIAMGLLGLYLILKGSEWITDAAVPLATYLNTTYIAVGLVLVSVLLSLPELLVSASSLIKGQSDISIGVVIGSIIVNLGLIIGLSAILRPLKIPRHVITRDAVFMLVATIVVALIVLDDLRVTGQDGLVFMLLFIPYLINIYEQEKQLAVKEKKKESEMITRTLSFIGKIGGAEVVIKDSRLVFVFGIAILLIGAELFTGSMIGLAAALGVPGILVGLTIGALGPSIPNLAAALQAIRKGYDELAVSETIGSNIFTLLVTMGMIAIVHPFTLDAATAQITIPALLIITGAFFVFAFTGTISRLMGAVLLVMYILTLVGEIVFRG
ncbi:MAG TPA: sodium:calcium antiporter [Candidatus Bilamarchaeum sp.]|nr:sodium:calcium antiporter [Candidatus Bilamarchaeum sp.]